MINRRSTRAETAGAFADSPDAVAFVRLLLVRWDHPEGNNIEYAEDLLQSASEMLNSAGEGIAIGEDVQNPEELGFLEAVWRAESIGMLERSLAWSSTEKKAQMNWLQSVLNYFPECFQNQGT